MTTKDRLMVATDEFMSIWSNYSKGKMVPQECYIASRDRLQSAIDEFTDAWSNYIVERMVAANVMSTDTVSSALDISLKLTRDKIMAEVSKKIFTPIH